MSPFAPSPPAPLPPAAADPARAAAFAAWLARVAGQEGLDPGTLEPASADASFRRYFRVRSADGRTSAIVMDAPPPVEDVRPFVKVAALIDAAGLRAPRVRHADLEQGFLLLDDLGDAVYLPALQAAEPARRDALMRDAVTALVQWQARVPGDALPPFDDALLRRELALFPEWCVEREFGVRWSAREQASWNAVCDRLVASALAQPTVAVHADWMPRNLMLPRPGESGPGILDFQDAVRGPVTYDIASLLRDAFVSWDEAQELDWAVRWWQQARAAGVPLGEAMDADFGECWRALEWMGLQRHLKVLGIFCRLKHRDGKPRYAEDLPRFFAYAQKVAMRYAPLRPLLPLLAPLSGAEVGQGFTF